MEKQTPTFYAIGYSKYDLARMARLLESQDAILLDIRFSPYSCEPMWRKPELKNALGKRYHWLRSWGNVNYQVPGMENVEIADFNAGLERALNYKAQTVFLMCVCSKHDHCHRSIVAEQLQARGYFVQEWNSNLEQLPLF